MCVRATNEYVSAVSMNVCPRRDGTRLTTNTLDLDTITDETYSITYIHVPITLPSRGLTAKLRPTLTWRYVYDHTL